MAVAKRSASTTAFTSLSAGGNMTIAQPSGATSGDVVYIGVATGSGCTSQTDAATKVLATPSGWTLVGQAIAYMSAQGFTSNISVYRRKLDGTESWPITFTNTGGAVGGSFAFGEIHALALTGVDPTTQEDVTSTSKDAITQGGGANGAGGTAGQGQTTTWPTLTTVTNGAYLMGFESLWDAVSSTVPSSILGYEYNGGGTSSTTGSGLLGCWVGTQSTAGATGAITRSTNGNANTNQITTSTWGSVLIAVRPASTGLTGSASMAGTGALAAKGGGAVSAAGVGALSARGGGALTAAGTGALSAAGTLPIPGAMSSAGVGALSAKGIGVLNAAGVGAATFVSLSSGLTGALTAAGVGAMSAQGGAALSAAGAGALTGQGGAKLSAAGVGSATFAPPTVISGAATMAGVGTATFVGLSTAASSSLGGKPNRYRYHDDDDDDLIWRPQAINYDDEEALLNLMLDF
jgi:hypothetical protein